nr:hypothetical protein [uncultured Flavobacterium sp.]
MTALKNKLKKIQAIVALIENAEALKNQIITETEEVIETSELLLLQINTGEDEFLFI